MKQYPPLSASLEKAFSHFSGDERVDSWTLVSQIIDSHPEYAGGRADGLSGVPEAFVSEPRAVDEWLNGLSSLFDIERLASYVGQIDGRLAIWGLAQLDPNLKDFLDGYGVLEALEREYQSLNKVRPDELLQQSAGPASAQEQPPQPSVSPSNPGPEQGPFEVYISYNTQYRKQATELANRLRDQGLRVWIDIWIFKSDHDWANWVPAAKDALIQTRTVLVLVGPGGVSPRGQTEELEIILSSKVNQIIPILLPDTTPETIPPQLKDLRWVDFKAGLDDPEAWHDLMTGIFPIMASAPPPPPPPSSGAVPSILKLLLEKYLGGISAPKQLESTKAESSKDEERPYPPRRVLNAGFADPGGNFVKSDEALASNAFYDLQVDVGPVWKDDKSIVVKSEKAYFPEAKLPRAKSGYLVRTVFISEDFLPRQINADLWVPAKKGQSFPVSDGKRAETPGTINLRLCTPRLSIFHSQRRAYGRLCLYYKGQLIKSAVVSAGIARKQGKRLKEPNKVEMDYVLTGNFETSKRLVNRRVKFHKNSKPRPVAVNITLNDDGSGHHRILATYHLDQKEELTVPPAWKPYDAQAAQKELDKFRDVMASCYKGLDDSFGKSRKQFGYDMLELAKLGNRLRAFALGDLDVSATGRSVALWKQELLKSLEVATVIQIARTGPANYVFPWALVYEYPMPGPDYKLCKVIEEWNEAGIRDKPAGMMCPHRHETWHKENVVCPYGFWGIKHIIEQPPAAMHKKDSGWTFDVSDKVAIRKDIGLGMGVTFDIDSNSYDLHVQRLITKMKAHLEPQKPAYDRKSALEMLRAPEIVYFLCHGEADLDLTPYLNIGEHKNNLEYKIYPNTLEEWGIAGLDLATWQDIRPLVFINGCHTANLQPGIVLNFVSAFADLGASGIIGTEVSMRADLAMSIAEAILIRVAGRMEVGQAVREMRWEMLNRGNVLGLAYTPYSLANLHIERVP